MSIEIEAVGGVIEGTFKITASGIIDDARLWYRLNVSNSSGLSSLQPWISTNNYIHNGENEIIAPFEWQSAFGVAEKYHDIDFEVIESGEESNVATGTFTASARGMTAGTPTLTVVSSPIQGAIIANATNLSLAWSGAKPSSGSIVSSMRLSIGAQTWVCTAGASGTVSLGVVRASGTVNAILELVDARGFVSLSMVAIDIIPYSLPVVTSFVASRCDSDGTVKDKGKYIKVIATWQISSVIFGGTERNNQALSNSSVLAIEDVTGTYTNKWASSADVRTINNGNGVICTSVVSGGYDTEKSFNVKLTLKDVISNWLGTYSETFAKVGTEPTIFDFYAPQNANESAGVAIGKVAEHPNMCEVALPTDIMVGAFTRIKIDDNRIYIGKYNANNIISDGIMVDITNNSQKVKKITNGNVCDMRAIYISDANTSPSGGEDGDVWLRYSP